MHVLRARVYARARCCGVRASHRVVLQPLLTPVRHGHVDHCFGVFSFDDEHKERGLPIATVVAHRNVAQRFDRYKLTRGTYSLLGYSSTLLQYT